MNKAIAFGVGFALGLGATLGLGGLAFLYFWPPRYPPPKEQT